MKYIRLLLVLLLVSNQAGASTSLPNDNYRPLFMIIVACNKPVAIVLLDPYTGQAFVSDILTWRRNKPGIALAKSITRKLERIVKGRPPINIFPIRGLNCKKKK